ncbi:hypothetical protein THOM_1689, partial [Trachipleistophora hominis]
VLGEMLNCRLNKFFQKRFKMVEHKDLESTTDMNNMKVQSFITVLPQKYVIKASKAAFVARNSKI